MSQIIKFLFFCITAMVLASCSVKSVRIKSAPVTDSLHLESLAMHGGSLMPTRMLVSGDKLVIFQRKSDVFFQVYKLPFDGSFYATGPKGRGPNEFISPDVQSMIPCNGGFRMADSDGSINTVTLTDSSAFISSKAYVDAKGSPLNGMIPLKDSYLNVNMYGDKYEYVVYDILNDESRLVSPYPDWGGAEEAPLLFTYMKNLAGKPEGDRFAAFYVNFRAVRFFDYSGKVIKEAIVDFPEQVPQNSSDPRNKYLCYASYPYSDSRIVANLCKNRRAGEKVQTTELHIWNWDGDLIRILVLDKDLDLFTIDSDSELLYGLSVSEPETLYCCSIKS